MIEIRNIVKRYGELEVLKGIDLDIVPAAVTSVVGPSGAGKTTLLQIAGTLMTPDRGTVSYDGTDVFSLGGSRRSATARSALCFSSIVCCPSSRCARMSLCLR